MAGTTTYVLVVFVPDEDSTAKSRTATSTESLKFASGRKLEKDMVPVLRARALGTPRSKKYQRVCVAGPSNNAGIDVVVDVLVEHKSYDFDKVFAHDGWTGRRAGAGRTRMASVWIAVHTA